MKGRTLLFATIVAAALAATSCTEEQYFHIQPTPVPPLTCAGLAFLSPNPQNPAQAVTFDLSSFVAPGFPTTYVVKENVGGQIRTTFGGSPDKATMFCENVISLDDYVIVQGQGGSFLEKERVFGDYPDHVAYVFKKSASSPSGLDFVGAAPNFGKHEKFFVLKNYGNAGDLLIAASEAKWARNLGAGGTAYYKENNQMLNAMAQAVGFKNFEDGNETSERVVWVNGIPIRDTDRAMSTQELIKKAMELNKTGLDMDTEIRFEETTSSFKLNNGIIKIVIYKLPEQTVPYNPSAKPPTSILEKMAAVPLVLGNNPILKQMELVVQGGEPYLKLAARFEGKGTVRSYSGGRLSDILGGRAVPGGVTTSTDEFHYIGPQLVPIKGILEQGQAWTEPLLK